MAAGRAFLSLLLFGLATAIPAAFAADAAPPGAAVAPAFEVPPTSPAQTKPTSTPVKSVLTYFEHPLFAAPVALLGVDNQPVQTEKALGCPAVVDFNGDGKNDILLGAHESMDTAIGAIYLIPNTGSNEQPRLDWAKAVRAGDGKTDTKVGCGCKSAGNAFAQAVDWNDDGFVDIAVHDSYREAYILVNDAKDKARPTFHREEFFKMEKTNHGMMAGGGDWNGDGVADFLHMPFAGGAYKLFPGAKQAKGGLQFETGGLKKSKVLVVGGLPGIDRAVASAWAGDFSGTGRERDVTEYVGMGGDEKQDICLFELKDGKSSKVATLVTFKVMRPQLTVGDLNGDGRPDILFAGGDFKHEKQHTQIYVMYGQKPAVTANTAKK